MKSHDLINSVILPDIPESESVSRCFSSLGTGVDGAGPMKIKKYIEKNHYTNMDVYYDFTPI